jgi:hypothetical protein
MLISTGIKIDGTDITDLIAYQGVQWKRNDIDGPNAGRTLSGLMIRDRVATKIRLDITCRILNREEVRTLLNLLMPEFVFVTYDDPMDGVVTRTMYANNNEAKFLRSLDNDSDELWDNGTFPLVER